MGVITGIANMAGSVMTVGSSVIRTVSYMGKSAFGLIGGIAKSVKKSVPGKIMLGAGAGLAIKGVIDKASESKSSGFGAFAGALKDSVENAVGGAASLVKGLLEKSGLYTGSSGKTLEKSSADEGKLEKAIASAERSQAGSQADTDSRQEASREEAQTQQPGFEGPGM